MMVDKDRLVILKIKAGKGLRTLEDICELNPFVVDLLGNTYCSLALNRRINCKYQNNVLDHNGCYVCLNPEYNVNDYKTKIKN